MHGRLWCPGVYGSRYQHTRASTSERLVPAGTATPSHTANHQVIMRDQRYGPILIVRIECGGAGRFCCCFSASLPLCFSPDPERREPTATGLHRSFDAIRGDIRYRTRSCLLRSRKDRSSPISSLCGHTNFIPNLSPYPFFRDFLSRKKSAPRTLPSSRLRRLERER